MRNAIIMALLLAVFTSSFALAQGEGQVLTATLTQEVSAPVQPTDGDYDVVVDRTSEVPGLKARIEALGAQRNARATNRPSGRSGHNGASKSEIASLRAEILALQNELSALKNAGYITQAEADILNAKIDALMDDPAPEPEKEKRAMEIPVWAIVLGAIVLLYALFGRRDTPATPVAARFSFDPNKEAADSADAVKNPGYRRIVSADARGNYHSETARGRDVMVAEALAEADSMGAIMEYFADRREARASRKRIFIAEPEPEVVVMKRPVPTPKPAVDEAVPAEPATTEKTAEEKKADEAKAAKDKKAADAAANKGGGKKNNK